MPPTTPRFVEITRLAQEGYGDSARTVIARILTQTEPTEAAFPEALYTAAAVAKTLADARLHYARIAVEFPESPWADKSILRLAQLDYGSGNSESAVMRIKRLFTDYPESAVIPIGGTLRRARRLRATRRRARLRLADPGPAAGRQRRRTEEPARVRAATLHPGGNRAPRGAPQGRQHQAAGDPRRRHRRAPTPSPGHAAHHGRRPRLAVARAGRRDQRRRRRSVARCSSSRQAGFTVYRVAGPNGLTKLQAGPFATREAAVAAVGKLKAVVGGAPFVVKAP